MTTTTATLDPTEIADLQARVQTIRQFLRDHNIERDEMIDLLLLMTISGVDGIFIGDPGVGKTWAIELLVNYCLTDMDLFTHLFAKDQSASEILGMPDPNALKQGKFARMLEGMMPEANFAYFDEVFKSSPPMLNPMLDVLANRKLKVGGREIDCSQLITIFMSSNELPDREDLQAFRDRIGITYEVHPVKTPEGRRAVTDLQLDFQAGGIVMDGLEPLALDEVHALRAASNLVVVPSEVRDVMVDMERQWEENGHLPSQRRIGQMWKVVKARAFMSGREEAVTDDFLPVQFMAWNHPDDYKTAREVVIEVASAFTREAALMREATEPIIAEMEKLKHTLASADQDDRDNLLADGWKFMRQLRTFRKDARTKIANGKNQGQDTSMLEDVVVDLDKTLKWAEGAMTGLDDD